MTHGCREEESRTVDHERVRVDLALPKDRLDLVGRLGIFEEFHKRGCRGGALGLGLTEAPRDHHRVARTSQLVGVEFGRPPPLFVLAQLPSGYWSPPRVSEEDALESERALPDGPDPEGAVGPEAGRNPHDRCRSE